MQRKQLAVAIAAALFSLGVVAAEHGDDPGAQDAPAPGVGSTMDDMGTGEADTAYGEEFSQLDQAGDGHITREEASAMRELAENFDRADQDGDGVIDEAEFAQFMEAIQAGEAGELPGESPQPEVAPEPGEQVSPGADPELSEPPAGIAE
ncbi:EF-hand domain-containing protein [Ectothiorhodospiraceae bacterium 2226]|nr:EF-hand domain-containing protein [Ectothiorhodospiraceae bacterium 2226]